MIWYPLPSYGLYIIACASLSFVVSNGNLWTLKQINPRGCWEESILPVDGSIQLMGKVTNIFRRSSRSFNLVIHRTKLLGTTNWEDWSHVDLNDLSGNFRALRAHSDQKWYKTVDAQCAMIVVAPAMTGFFALSSGWYVCSLGPP